MTLCPLTRKPMHNRKTALTRAAHSRKAHGVEIYIYKCPVCKAWHLTRSEQTNEEYNSKNKGSQNAVGTSWGVDASR